MSHVKGFFTGIIIPIILGLIIAFFIRNYIGHFNSVSGESMVPTFQDGDYLLTERISTHFNNYEIGDIVIVKTKDDRHIIKRIIGMPGDIVEFIPANTEGNAKSFLRVNGKTLEEPYINEEMDIPEYSTLTVEDNHYFVLGDNRNKSADSRYYGTFPESNIKGVVILELADNFKRH